MPQSLIATAPACERAAGGMEQGSPSGLALFSCDVFETALVRLVGTPSTLFLILGTRLAKQGLIQSSPEAFAHSRMEANRRARSNAGRGMGLTDIYLELQSALGLSDTDRDAIQAEELALESELLVPVPGAAERVARAREAGMAIAFLSDMYLGSSFIRAQLQRYGMTADGDGCYVSCEVGCGKEDGRAYRAMASREAVDLGRVLHRGNDPRADIAAARAAGIATEPFLEGNLNRYEEVLESHTYGTGGLSSVMAGAARLARLSVDAQSPHAQILRDVAASVGGPAIVSFVLSVLLQSRDLGIRRLYFQARHGHLLRRVARSLIDTLGLDCEARDLHVGTEASVATGEALDYWRQEGLLDDSDWALVDVAWRGGVLDALDRILRTGGGKVPAVFSFTDLAKTGSPTASRVSLQAYLSDNDSRRVDGGPLDERFLEVFAGIDTAEVVGYRADGHAIVPILADRGNPALSRWGLEVVHETILSFADWLWLDAGALDLTADLRPAVADVLRRFLTSPPAAEARAWGGYPVESGRKGAVHATIAAPFTIRELPHAMRHGRIRIRRGAEWIEGGLAITPPVTRTLLKTSLGLRERLATASHKVRRVLTRS